VDSTLLLRNFGQTSLTEVTGGDRILARKIVKAAKNASKSHGLVYLPVVGDNNVYWTCALNALLGHPNPELVMRLSFGKTGAINFVMALTCEPTPGRQYKIRHILITPDKLKNFLPDDYLKGLQFEDGNTDHADRAKMLHTIATLYFGNVESGGKATAIRTVELQASGSCSLSSVTYYPGRLCCPGLFYELKS
jgi:hypothetical protein